MFRLEYGPSGTGLYQALRDFLPVVASPAALVAASSAYRSSQRVANSPPQQLKKRML